MTYEEQVQQFTENEKLVPYILSRYFNPWLHDEDVLQMGRVGLWLACQNYDQSQGTFSSFACKCIYNEVFAYWREVHRKKRIPDTKKTSIHTTVKGKLKSDADGKELIDILAYQRPMSIWCNKPLKELLTPRQWKILLLIIDEKTVREIGALLGVSHTTVTNEKAKIRQIIVDNFVDI